MRILLLSAYHSASHRYWCEGMMAALPEHDWTLRTQPARHFSWRLNASGWIWGLEDDPDMARDYDLVIATSLTGLPALFASQPALRAARLWVYFHENQFAHPLHADQQAAHQTGWQFASIENALLADRISFNSHFNRDSFLAGATELIGRMPEHLPGDPLTRMGERSDVLPVPLTDEFAAFSNAPKDTRLIVWSHRWEWDKRPERLLAALVDLHREGVDFRLAMMGSGGGRTDKFERERTDLETHLVHWGEAGPADYRRWVACAGIGVSTAIHDFQGLSMLELAQAGARTVVPRRLAYPELLPEADFYEPSDDPEEEHRSLTRALAQVLNNPGHGPANPAGLPIWKTMAEDYRRTIDDLFEGE